MSMKQELETWVAALQCYERNEFEESINTFRAIADTSKILFNCGIIRATLGEHEAAVQYYERALTLDPYLAIAYFQAGVSNFLSGDFEQALRDFNNTMHYLRGNSYIDYEQLGLKYKLWACEALFNRGLCYIYLREKEIGLADMKFAAKEKAVEDHDVIDEAIRDNGEGYTVFSMPVGVVFRPSEAKVKNVRTRDYLGKTQLRLCADVKEQNLIAQQHRRNLSIDAWSKDDRPPEKVSFAASNLVNPGLLGRSRQQSEPPVGRNVFPPTPPPEADKPASLHSVKEDEPNPAGQRSESRTYVSGAPRSHSATRAAKPEKLELGVAAFEHAHRNDDPVPARRIKRSESERPQIHRTMTEPAPQTRVPRRNDSLPRVRSEASREQLYGAIDNGGPRVSPNGQSSKPSLRVRTEEALNDQHLRHSPQKHQSPSSAHSQTRSRSALKAQTSFSQSKQRPPSIVEEEDKGGAEVLEDEIPIRFSGSTATLSPPVIPDLHSAQKQQSSSHSAVSASSYFAPMHFPSTRPVTQGQVNSSPLRSLRVKVRFGEDTRYMIASPRIGIKDFKDQIKRKFEIKGEVKIRTRDEDGDMITMADQDDLDMAIAMCERSARKDGSSAAHGEAMGKMEVSVQGLDPALDACLMEVYGCEKGYALTLA